MDASIQRIFEAQAADNLAAAERQRLANERNLRESKCDAAAAEFAAHPLTADPRDTGQLVLNWIGAIRDFGRDGRLKEIAADLISAAELEGRPEHQRPRFRAYGLAGHVVQMALAGTPATEIGGVFHQANRDKILNEMRQVFSEPLHFYTMHDFSHGPVPSWRPWHNGIGLGSEPEPVYELSGQTLPTPATNDNGPEYLFRDEGEFLHIRFDGEAGRIRKLIGGEDFMRLLKSPGTSISCVELANGCAAFNEPAIARQENQDEIINLRSNLREYDEMIARETNEGQRLLLESERDAVEVKIKAKSGLGGQARGADPPERKRVANRMKTFREVCAANGLPRLAEFLERNVTAGADCRYIPPSDAPDWHF